MGIYNLKKKLNLKIEKNMRLYDCWFCSSTLYPGHGKVFVRNDCKIFRFCRGKCYKAFLKKRNPLKVRWTKSYRKHNKKDIFMNVKTGEKNYEAVKYDRRLMMNTLKSIQKFEKNKLIKMKNLQRKRFGESINLNTFYKKKEIALKLIERRRKKENRQN